MNEFQLGKQSFDDPVLDTNTSREVSSSDTQELQNKTQVLFSDLLTELISDPRMPEHIRSMFLKEIGEGIDVLDQGYSLRRIEGAVVKAEPGCLRYALSRIYDNQGFVGTKLIKDEALAASIGEMIIAFDDAMGDCVDKNVVPIDTLRTTYLGKSFERIGGRNSRESYLKPGEFFESVITDDERNKMNEKYEEMKSDSFHVGDLAVYMKFITPDSATIQSLDDKEFSLVSREFNRLKETSSHAVSVCARAKLLFPGKEEPLIENIDIPAVKDELKQLRAFSQWDRFVELALNASILFPGLKKEIGLDEMAWHGLRIALEEALALKRSRFAIKLAAQMKLVFPENEREIRFRQEELDQMRNAMQEARKSNIIDFAEMSFFAKILSSDNVEITKHGELKISA